MDFLTKNALKIELEGVQNLEADKKLLTKVKPSAACLNKTFYSPELESKEILIELLDHASKDEIITNRKVGIKEPDVIGLIERVKSLIKKKVNELNDVEKEDVLDEYKEKGWDFRQDYIAHKTENSDDDTYDALIEMYDILESFKEEDTKEPNSDTENDSKGDTKEAGADSQKKSSSVKK